MEQNNKVHVFEQRGLGKAPFTFVGMEVKTYQACQGAPVQPGGCCDYCGTGIMEHCYIQDATGKRFVVGNSCVTRTGDKGLINPVKRALNALRNEARHKKEQEKIAAIKKHFNNPKVQAILKSKAHPNWSGKSLFDYVNWMLLNAGNKGRLAMGNYIDEAIREGTL